MRAVTLPRGAYFDYPLKGAGLFGSAPEVAASIHRKPEGLRVDGNESSVTGSVLLKDGDFIDCGGTTMQFVLKETNN